MALVDNKDIEEALLWGAKKLEKIKIANDAPPVFLLDSNRRHRFKMNVSVFDNSWDIYDQDMPTGKYLKNNGINKIIVRSEKINQDLASILYKFQNIGITIFFTDGYKEIKEITIKKPRKIK